MVIAIDGPSGVGKSTVSRAVATMLGLAYLDTGATYRAATLAVLDAGIDITDVHALVAELAIHALDYDERGIVLDGEPVGMSVRSDAVTSNVSVVSAHPLVRCEIVNIQRSWVEDHDGNAVVEGRDIGTVVFPHAPIKVFLTASPDIRAQRRAGDSETDGRSIADIAASLAERDAADTSRKASPLRPADDAVIIDTGELTFDEVVEAIVSLAT